MVGMTTSYNYTSAVLNAIDLISQGYTRTNACDESLISTSILDSAIKRSEIIEDLYDDANQRGMDAMADALVTIDSDQKYGHTDPKMAKVISDNIKWLLSKRNTKNYGDRIEVKHTLTADKAITQALLAGQQRALQAVDNNVIDVTPIEGLQSDP